MGRGVIARKVKQLRHRQAGIDPIIPHEVEGHVRCPAIPAALHHELPEVEAARRTLVRESRAAERASLVARLRALEEDEADDTDIDPVVTVEDFPPI